MINRSYYSSDIKNFIEDNESRILGELTLHHIHALEDLQRNAWLSQIQILKVILNDLSEGYIFFEFGIPRMGKRVDNVLIINDLIFVIEFKIGGEHYEKHAVDQVIDYSLDLKNFHEGSHNAKVIPILVSTKAPNTTNEITPFQDNLYKPLLCNKDNLLVNIKECISEKGSTNIDALEWEKSIYKPTPTIIEAAQALYKGHNVKEISRSDSGAINLSKTSKAINQIIDDSKKNKKKSICFVTGVPGSGKTLAGLNIANERMQIAEDEHAVFLSGNGPLVDVLREALTRDEVAESKKRGEKLSKKEAAIKANAFIQNIHHFRDDALITDKPPIEKVVVFDEAQRAWTHKQASSFMKRKKGVENFNMSEPQFLIDIMNRHDEWCTIICLIGGGQEINVGEAGLDEWIHALNENFKDWNVYYSNQITENKNYINNAEHKDWLNKKAKVIQDLHLSVSIRSFRSEKLSSFVHAILDNEIEKAKEIYINGLQYSYPIVITRDFEKAKQWLKIKARGNERYGTIAPSGGCRLRPYGINVKASISAPIWFLNDKEDIRSSYYMEEVATEFDIQGLELDWTCVCWDSDLYYRNNEWKYRQFKGTKWQNIKQETTVHYLVNAYRVLLTRARQGMVIFIPNGDHEDKTRQPEMYNETYELFKSLSIKEIG